MFRVQGQVTIARPATAVSRFLVHLENEAKWMGGVQGLRLLSGQPGEVGAKYERNFVAMGKPRQTTIDVAAYEPGKRIVVASAPGPVQVTGTMTLEEVPEGTRVDLAMDATTKGFTRLFQGSIRKSMAHQLPQDLAKLKQVVEAEVPEKRTPAPKSAKVAPAKAAAKGKPKAAKGKR